MNKVNDDESVWLFIIRFYFKESLKHSQRSIVEIADENRKRNIMYCPLTTINGTFHLCWKIKVICNINRADKLFTESTFHVLFHPPYWQFGLNPLFESDENSENQA